MSTTTDRLYNAEIRIRDFQGNVEVPKWVDQDIDTSTIAAIIHSQEGNAEYFGDLNSGVYMPAVTYFDAGRTMFDHGDDLLTFIESQGHDVPPIEAGQSWLVYECRIVSLAVVAWAYSVADELADCVCTDYESDLTDLKSEFLDGSDGDNWGSCMGAFFAVASELSYRGDDTPLAWGYSPGAVSDPRDPADSWFATLAGSETDTLLQFGAIMHRYSRQLRARGESY